MIRLLLVTLLTTTAIVLTAPIIPSDLEKNSENVTATATTLKTISVTSIPVTTTTLKTTTQLDQSTFIDLVQPELNSSIPEMQTEVITDSEPVEISIGHYSIDQEDHHDSNEGENKIETKHEVGDAPKINLIAHEPLKEPTEILNVIPEAIVPGDDEEYGNMREFDLSTANSDDVDMEMDSDDSDDDVTSSTEASASTPSEKLTTTTPESTTTTKILILKYSDSDDVKTTSDDVKIESTTSKDSNDGKIATTTSPDSGDSDDSEGVVLPNDHHENVTDSDSFVDKPYNGDVYPLTFWDRTNNYIRSLTEEPGRFSAAISCVLFTIIAILLFLVARECCKTKRGFSSINRRGRNPPSVTADLYNTSDCSHFYQKPTLLLNQQEVTMQLVSSDVSSDDIV